MKKNILLACFIAMTLVTTGFLYMGIEVSTRTDQHYFVGFIAAFGYVGSIAYYIAYRSHNKSSN